eukprot:TRINITY_DN4939_c0_g2_i2.p1 TRINITY_DN4939_c0_g2~~TRINITY_DN4939_c0_g2_i2.p1  ORF type:complete len:1059 (-),score=186.23 TRINITY_DN4939_c0_g2_i2:408-3584(-)
MNVLIIIFPYTVRTHSITLSRLNTLRSMERPHSDGLISSDGIWTDHTPRDKNLQTPRTFRKEYKDGTFPSRKGRHRVDPRYEVYDVETLLEQLRQTKILVAQLREEKMKLQTRIYRMEAEIRKLQKHNGLSHDESDEKARELKPRPPAKAAPETPRSTDYHIHSARSLASTTEIRLLREQVSELRKILNSKTFTSREVIESVCKNIETKLNSLESPKQHEGSRAESRHEVERITPPPTIIREPKPPQGSGEHPNVPPSLLEVASMSRAPSFRPIRRTGMGPVTTRSRQSISLVFSSSSILMFPHGHSVNAVEGGMTDSESENAISRQQSSLNGIDLHSISWKGFQDWHQGQDPAKHSQILQELFSVIKGSQKVFEVTSTISFSQTVEEVVERFREGAKDVLYADEVHLFVVDSSMQLSPVYHDRGMAPPASQIGVGVIGKVAESGEPLNIKDVAFNEIFNPETDMVPGLSVRSMLVVPLADRSSQVFAVAAAYKRNDFFAKEDEILLQALADQTSNNMQQFKLLLKTIREQQKNKAISEVLKIVNNDKATFDQVIDTIIRVTYDIMQVDRVSFFLVDNIAKQLLLKVSKDNATIRVPIGVGIAGTVAATGQIINIPDAYQDPRFDRSFDLKTGFRTRTILCVPIFDNNKKPVAVIQVLNKAHGVFTKDDEELIQTFTAEAASVIQRQSLQTAYHNLMASSDSFSADTIKDLLGDYTATRKIISDVTKPRMDIALVPRPRVSSRQMQMDACVDLLKDWNLDHFSFTDEEIYDMIVAGFDSLDLLSHFKVDPDMFRIFLQVVRSNYRENPYHNFQHAFSVFHCSYLAVTTTEIPNYLTALDMFALFIATLCHDLDHPGTNNAFMMNSNSTLAVVYNDISVLENHHSSLTFQITQDPKVNIFANLEPAEKTELRKTIIPAILATDMAEHSKLTTNLSVHGNSFQKESKEDRQFLVNIILHSSDLCNPILPTERAYCWATRVLQEFNDQAKRERELSMPVAAFMEKSDEVSKANLNIGFIKYVVSPLWTRFAEIFPSLRHCIERMEVNIKSWEKIIADNPSA